MELNYVSYFSTSIYFKDLDVLFFLIDRYSKQVQRTKFLHVFYLLFSLQNRKFSIFGHNNAINEYADFPKIIRYKITQYVKLENVSKLGKRGYYLLSLRSNNNLQRVDDSVTFSQF